MVSVRRRVSFSHAHARAAGACNEDLVRVGVAQQEGDDRAPQVLEREGHARLALEHGLDDLGLARRVERLAWSGRR